MKYKKTKYALIAGARPNFVKIMPLYHMLKKRGDNFFLVNTGQHFDKSMSDQFFKEFKLRPHFSLKPSHESLARQLSDIVHGLEIIFRKEKPDVIFVVGDVTSTLAGALVANKLGILLVHIEAGLRSHNKYMPEETNRIIVDHLSNIRLASEETALKNLEDERIEHNSYLVGNIMMDTLSHFLPIIKSSKEKFYFCTLHRPENVDNPEVFKDIIDALEEISKDAKIYLSLHPRTRRRAEEFGLLKRIENIFKVLSPLSYSKTLFYQKNAKLVLTDSGGIQEEASFMGVPCITLRTETERPITVTHGTNIIAGVTTQSILDIYKKVKSNGLEKRKTKIPLWDGKATKRILDIISLHNQRKIKR
ncbi:MAG: UDP-N-acetylglucosamine 2-epimerase (non-hydrolyzing) [Patescibacteria group bacterium]